MATTKSQSNAVLERWMRVLYANYLRYSLNHALAWHDRSGFGERELVERLVAGQQALFDRMSGALLARGGVMPPMGYPEDVAYLNYLHLPVIFRRAAARMAATVAPVQDDTAMFEKVGEFELADMGEAYVALMESQCSELRPFCETAESVSPR
jgi:hypothetical protein